MPNYHCAQFIGQAIESVLSQSYQHWQLIIVDDASKDESAQIVKSYQKQDPRIELIELKKNLGATLARNIGIEKSKGSLLAFLDSDDLWLPNRLKKSVDFLLKNKYSFVYSSYRRCDEYLNPLLSDYIVPKKLHFNDLLYHNPIFTSSVLIHMERIGKYYQTERALKREDHGLWFSIMKDIDCAYGILEPLCIYRIRKGSLSRNKIEMAKFQYLLYRNYLKFSFYRSLYYTFHWAVNGLRKYRK